MPDDIYVDGKRFEINAWYDHPLYGHVQLVGFVQGRQRGMFRNPFNEAVALDYASFVPKPPPKCRARWDELVHPSNYPCQRDLDHEGRHRYADDDLVLVWP